MRLRIVSALMLVLVLLLMGCNMENNSLKANKDESTTESKKVTNEKTEKIEETEKIVEQDKEIDAPEILKISNLLPSTYNSEEAISNGDVVNLHGTIYNIEILNDFISNVNDGNEDEIRITQYTIEGDPIIDVLIYDGDLITYYSDNSRDKYGSTNIYSLKFDSIELVDFTRDKREMAELLLETTEEDKTIMMYYKD